MEDARYRNQAQIGLPDFSSPGVRRRDPLNYHGHQEMVAEDIPYDAVREVLLDCQVIENYPDHQRGPCCLVCGRTSSSRFLHVVCTTSLDVIVIITVYEPKPPKWAMPFERGGRDEM